MNNYLKALYALADSKTGEASYTSIDKKYGKGTSSSLHHSGYCEEIYSSEKHVLRIRLEGYALVHELRTNRNARVFNVLSLVLSAVSLALSAAAVVLGVA